MVYFITYDLNNPGQNYDDVINAIKEASTAWCSYWKSSYLIKATIQVRTIFKQKSSLILIQTIDY